VDKRTWIGIAVVLVLLLALAGCNRGQLGKDMTPIPTLPPGEEPALVDAIQAGMTPQGTAAAQAGGAATTPAPTEAGTAATGEGDPAAGQVVFEANCAGCHAATDGAGPALPGMGERAATRVQGMTAVAYLHESIVDPAAHVVEGFNDIRPHDFGTKLSDTDINNLVAFLLTQ